MFLSTRPIQTDNINRDRSDYRFDTHKWIDWAGADYLTDNDDISVFLFGPITSPKVTMNETEILESGRVEGICSELRMMLQFCGT